ncbi:autoinducer binding domain-containing protein [Roseospirillum parvum]|nr:autoinducer binding domain-containing protein [Roseospirillum parvum]
MADRLGSLVDATPTDEAVPRLERWLADLIGGAGFDGYAWFSGRAFNPRRGGHDMWAVPPLFLNRFPPDWVATYLSEDFGAIDPVVVETLRRRLPYAWDAEQLAETHADPTRGFLNAACDHQVRRGVTLPVYGPGGEFALMSVISRAGPADFKRLVAEQAHALHLFSLHLQPLLAGLEGTLAPSSPSLSPREREVLTWTADGKTAAEISLILGIGERTVLHHTYKALRKLDSFSKPQAVAKALRLGLIEP